MAPTLVLDATNLILNIQFGGMCAAPLLPEKSNGGVGR